MRVSEIRVKRIRVNQGLGVAPKVGGSDKVQNYADMIYGWFHTRFFLIIGKNL